tara:strand:+ start:805 stop:2598 length:1794 start_codon:yes stop_codon:yes gene_type:complete
MRLITSVAEIDSTLNEPGFWTLEKLQMLDAIHTEAGTDRKVNRTLLDKLNRTIAKRISALTSRSAAKTSLTDVQKMAVNEVLERLQDHGWQVFFYPLSVKKMRPSTLPTEPRDLIYWRSIETWRCGFWEVRVGELDREDAVLALILELNASLGVNLRALRRAMYALTPDSAIDGTVQVPVLDEDNSPVIKLPLNARFRLLWSWYLRQIPDPIGAWQGQIKQLSQTLKTLPLDAQWKSLPKNQRKRWAGRLLRSGSFSMIENGIAPFIVTVLQADILPLPPPCEIDGFGYHPTDKAWPRLIHRRRPRIDNQASNLENSDDSDQAPSDNVAAPSFPPASVRFHDEIFSVDGELIEQIAWLPACQHMVRRLQTALRKTCIEPSGHFLNRRLDADTVDEILAPIRRACFEWLRWRTTELTSKDKEKEALLSFIDQLEQRFTALDLMIAWTRHRLVEQRITVETLNQDLRLVFARVLFGFESSADLSSWDDEDVEILIADHLIPSLSNPSSQRRAINLLKRVADWSRQEHRCFEGVFFPSTSATSIRLTWRNHIIGLQEHDLLQRQIKRTNTAYHEQVKAVFDLAFYAGIRSTSTMSMLNIN